MDNNLLEEKNWAKSKEYTNQIIKNERLTLGYYCTHWIKNSPRRMIFDLSYYKFAAKLLGNSKTILEIGSNEGLGTNILAEFSSSVTAVDFDADAVETANKNFGSSKVQFINENFLNSGQIGQFDGVVCFDTIMYINPDNENLFFENVCTNLKKYGVFIVGTTNENALKYSSEISKQGNVNPYSWNKLQNTMEKYFNTVFIFSANDEIVHTGFYEMANYFISVGICKK